MDSDYDEFSALNDDLQRGSDTEHGENEENISNTLKWTVKDVKLLLHVRLSMEEDFKKGEKSRNTLWNIVLRKMLEESPQFKLKVNDVKRKFNNMLITYRRIKDRKSKTGRANIQWIYFDEFDSVYSERHDIEAPKDILFDSSNTVNDCYSEESSCGESIALRPSKRLRKSTPSSVSQILKYWKDEDEKEDKRHAERMKVEKERNDIEKEKNAIEKEKTVCLKGIQDILSKMVRE